MQLQDAMNRHVDKSKMYRIDKDYSTYMRLSRKAVEKALSQLNEYERDANLEYLLNRLSVVLLTKHELVESNVYFAYAETVFARVNQVSLAYKEFLKSRWLFE